MRLGLLLIFLGLWASVAWSRPREVALVSELKGTLRCQGQLRELFDTFQVGQTFVASKGSRWTLSFAPAGLRVSGEAGQFQILEEGVRTLQGSLTLRTSASALRGHGWEPLPREPEAPPENPRWLMDPVSESRQVELCWQAYEPVQEVELVVEGLPDHRQLFKSLAQASQGSLSLTLAEGQSYVLHLRGFSPPDWSGTRSHPFRILKAREIEALRKWEKEANDVELCTYYQQLGLTGRARATAEKLLMQYPDQETLRILARPQP